MVLDLVHVARVQNNQRPRCAHNLEDIAALASVSVPLLRFCHWGQYPRETLSDQRAGALRETRLGLFVRQIRPPILADQGDAAVRDLIAQIIPEARHQDCEQGDNDALEEIRAVEDLDEDSHGVIIMTIVRGRREKKKSKRDDTHRSI